MNLYRYRNMKEDDKLITADYVTMSKVEVEKQVSGSASANAHLKSKYRINDIRDWRDIPGWINDADWLFKKIVDECDNDDHLVEIGTYFGQSACCMGELIKNSKKNIIFDSIDSFETLDPSFIAGFHPDQFKDYRFSKELKTAPISHIVKMHLNILEIDNFVNVKVCESNYAHHFYDDNSLKMVYLDGDHRYDQIFNDMKSFWPKVKSGGYLCGDDIIFDGVKTALSDFKLKYKINSNDVKRNTFCWEIKKR